MSQFAHTPEPWTENGVYGLGAYRMICRRKRLAAGTVEA